MLNRLTKLKLWQARKFGLLDQVGAADRRPAKAQVGNRHRPRLLGVVHKVALGIVVGGLTDDLDRVFVSSHRSVGPKAVEHGLVDTFGPAGEVIIPWQMVLVTSSTMPTVKWFLGFVGFQVVEYGAGHAGVELFGAKPVAPADDPGMRSAAMRPPAPLRQSPSRRPGRAVHPTPRALWCGQARRWLDRVGQSRDESVASKGTVQAHLDHADLFALSGQVFDRFMHRLGAGAHQHDDSLGIRGADVVEEVVLPPDQLGELSMAFWTIAGVFR